MKEYSPRPAFPSSQEILSGFRQASHALRQAHIKPDIPFDHDPVVLLGMVAFAHLQMVAHPTQMEMNMKTGELTISIDGVSYMQRK